MATPVFKFQHPDLPSEDLYFIHNTYLELPQTIPMDLTTFIWYHFRTGRTLEGFFASWDNLNEFQASLNGASFDNHFNENQKQRLYDDALFGLSLTEAKMNIESSSRIRAFINSREYLTNPINEYAKPYIMRENIDVSYFYSHHYFIDFIWNLDDDKVDKDIYNKYSKEILLPLLPLNGLVLFYADDKSRKDKEFVLSAIRNDFRSIYFADDSLKKDKSFIIEAIKLNYKVIALISPEFQNDNDVIYESDKLECLSFFEKEIESIEATEYSYRTNSQEVHDEDCSQDTFNHYFIISNEIEETLLDLKKYAENGPFFFASQSSYSYELLKDDADYVLSIFKLWPHYLVDYNVFYYTASSRLLQSKEFIIELLKSETKGPVLWSWDKFPTSYWSDIEFVKAAIKVNGSSIQFVDESLKNDEGVLALISIKPIEIIHTEEDEDLPF